jgi:hypothetical protein
MGQQSAPTPYLNVTPARLFAINIDHDTLADNLYHQLVIKKTEYYHRRTAAKTTPKLSADMGLTRAEYESLQSLDALFAKDKLSKKAQAELRSELEGQASGRWKGWKHALRSDFSIPIDWYECETIKDVRGAILRYWVDNVRAQNSRKDLERLLGCSGTTIDKLYAEYDVVSVQQNRSLEIAAGFIDLRPEMKALQQKEQAEIWTVKFKIFDKDHNKDVWANASASYAPLYYKRHKNEVKKVLFLYIVPSFQYLKSVTSWRLNNQRLLVILAHWMICKQADLLADYDANPAQFANEELPELAPITSAKPEADKTPAEDKTTLSMQHVYTAHTDEFKHDQISLRIFMATGNKVLNDTVVNDDNEVLFTAKNDNLYSGFLTYLLDNSKSKLVKKSHELFGKEIEDYTDELNAEYQQDRLDMLSSLVEVPDFDMPDDDKVIQMPLDDKQADTKKTELSEREQRTVDFSNARYAAEHKERKVSPFSELMRKLEKTRKPDNTKAG